MSAGGIGFSYDARGNLTGDGTNSYAYTSENLLKTGPSGATLIYDPLGRLYQTVGGGVTTRLQYDGAALIAEYNASNAVQRRYVHGPGTDNPIVWYEGSAISNATRRFLMADERGSIVSITDSVGATIHINAYDEYGIPAPGNVGRFGYTGQTWLPEVGMWYYKARIYSPTLGRFLQADPIGYSDGMNWYNYVGSDPVNGSDPMGLREREGQRIKPIDPTFFQGAGGGDARPNDIVVNGSLIDFSVCHACSSALTFLGEMRIIDLVGSLERPGLLEMVREARAKEVEEQKEACKSSPFSDLMNRSEFPSVERDLVDRSRSSGFEHARSWYGGNLYGSAFNSGSSARVDIPANRIRGYNISNGLFFSRAFVLIHTHFNAAPGLSGLDGDVGFANSNNVPIMAIDFGTGRKNEYYCHSPEK